MVARVLCALTALAGCAALRPAAPLRRAGVSRSTVTEAAEEAPAVAEPVVPVVRDPVSASALKSAKGVDYTILMDMLRKGDFKMADQFTRDNLIFIADVRPCVPSRAAKRAREPSGPRGGRALHRPLRRLATPP